MLESSFFLALAVIFIGTFILGDVLERFRIPWLFSAIFIGLIAQFLPVLSDVFSSESIRFLGTIGMYAMLFMIGFEIDILNLLKSRKKYIMIASEVVAFSTFVCAIALFYLFNLNPMVSLLIALSFSTVGEAILVPILEEFKLVKKPLGEALIAVGVLDDFFELISLIFLSFIVSSAEYAHESVVSVAISLLALFLLTSLMTRFSEEGKKFTHHNVETIFILVTSIFFFFIFIATFADLEALASLLAGVALKHFIPRARIRMVENEIKALCYGFFAPIFFAWVGFTVSISSLAENLFLLAVITLISALGKIVPAYISSFSFLGRRDAFLFGIGLCTRFSVSMVIIKYLFEAKIIGAELYSILIASTSVFTIAIPIIFSLLISRR
jgi:Ca2+-transporting ATPase